MKKIISVILSVAIMCFISTIVFAAGGDVVGNVYSTDITAYMYYAPITSYNIGGKTCIDAEILNWHYGFDVYWHEDERCLDIEDKGGRFVSLQAMSGEIVESSVTKPGEVVCNYYETDIKAILNGKEIESYNIGGRTVICVEAMREHGYNVDWDEKERRLTISKPMDFYEYETDFGTIKSMHNYALEQDKIMFSKRGLFVKTDEKDYMLNIPSGRVFFDDWGMSYIKLTDLAEILGGECVMEEKTETSVSSWVNNITDEYDYYTYIFSLNYDTNVKPELTGYSGEELEPEYVDNAECILDLSSFPLMINGEEYVSKGFFRGQDFGAGIKAVDGEVYVSAYILIELFGYDHVY